MESKFTNFWSKNLTEEEKIKLIALLLDDKDILTDFDYLHNEEYIENEECDGKKHQIAFYNKNCLWQLNYSFGGTYFTLECIHEQNKASFERSFNDIKERLFVCTDGEDTPIVHIVAKNDNHYLIVGYYSLG